MDGDIRPELEALRERIERTLDAARSEARAKRQNEWRETADDPDKALGFLRRTAMFEGVERARSIQ